VSYLNAIRCRNDFNLLKGKPLSEKYGNVEAVKVIYVIEDSTVYFSNSTRYKFHHDFTNYVLGDGMDVFTFNETQYKDNKYRRYLLANVNHYTNSGIYTLEFFAGDDFKDEHLLSFFKKLKEQTYFGKNIRILISTPETEEKRSRLWSKLPFLNIEDLYAGQTYQALNYGVAYGRLRKIEVADLDSVKPDGNDILVTNGLPNDIPLVAGIITTQFQTPLCHVNILSHNRGTPNAALKGAWRDTLIEALNNKLVRYEVTENGVKLRAASIDEAQQAMRNKQFAKKVLKIDTMQYGLLEMSALHSYSVRKVGGKAANFAELKRIRLDDGSRLPLPEGAFAIPFCHYLNHLKRHGIDKAVDSLLTIQGSIGRQELDAKLKAIRQRIVAGEMDSMLLGMVVHRLQKDTLYKAFRFRSSTNAEDIAGFNGAGLYTSKTGIAGDTNKPVDKAIKKVWASLWEERAFEERSYFNIDQHSLAMGVLVHRSFGEEAANGVAITKHLYRSNYPAFTINVQKGESSVVLPEDSSTCDQFMASSGSITGSSDLYLEYISRSSLNGGKPVMTKKEVELLVKYLDAIKLHFYSIASMKVRNQEYINFAVDVEFKLDKGTRKLYIKQARAY
jgi:hypothetical protein